MTHITYTGYVSYAIISVVVISLLSFVGAFIFVIKLRDLKKYLIYLVSFAAGALFGDAFLHLVPEAIKSNGFNIQVSLSLLFGIVLSFSIEKFIHWRHCHFTATEEHIHPFAVMNLVGDGVHNFIDGVIIVASYMASIPTGIATTLAVMFHEIPQEMGDLGVLVHGGFSKSRALFFNFITAITAILGAFIAILVGSFIENITGLLVSFAAGSFIYIAGADLIPELHKESRIKTSILQLLSFLVGIAVMILLLPLG